MTSRLARIPDPTPRDRAMLRHATGRGDVLLATGDRARLTCWGAAKARVLVHGMRATVPVGDVWPLCVCGEPCHAPSLDAGYRLCEGCIAEARDRAIYPDPERTTP